MHKRVFTQTFAVVGAIIERDGKILLVQESGGHDKGKWNQPAGWIDIGEDPLVAVMREIKEETGLDFTPEAIIGVYSLVKESLREKVEAGVPHGFKIIYKGSVIGEVGNFEKDVANAKWFTPEEIQSIDGTTLRDRDIPQEVADYFSGKSYPLDLIRHFTQV